MFQTLVAFSAKEIFFDLIAGLFRTVARIYDALLSVIEDSSLINSISMNDFAKDIYVLAGLFMLFRIIIGLLQMLVNPDMVNDKQVGAGKLLTRIVVCILLLLLFQPDGILLKPETGLLDNVEGAILDSNGLINNVLIGSEKIGAGRTLNTKKEKSKACYYIRVTNDDVKYYKVTFYNYAKNGTKAVDGSGGVYYKVNSGVVGGKSSGGTSTYSDINKPIAYSDGLINSNGNLTCPASFTYSGDKYRTSSSTTSDSKIIGGWKSVSELKSKVKGIAESKTTSKIKGFLFNCTEGFANILLKAVTGFNIISEKMIKFASEKIASEIVDVQYLTDLTHRDAALYFSRSVAVNLQECATGSEDECQEAQKDMFGSSKADEKVAQLLVDGNMSMDLFISIIIGIGLIVYMAFLLVDVIIRKFKLMLLELLAPIPIASYADPKDKVFNNWIKMLLSVYVDVFIKLFAIKVAVILLSADKFQNDNSVLLNLLYIIAILIFAKAIPSMISKIFGLDGMGSSFKDIGKMFKAGAGIATGAAIGGAVGAITGKGAGGRILGGLGGALRGAGSGAKGNVLGGAKSISASNKVTNDAKAAGMGFFDRAMASVQAKTGIPNAYQKAKEDKSGYDEYLARQKAYNDESLAKVNKAMGNGYSNANAEFKALAEGRDDLQKISNGEKVSKWIKTKNDDGSVTYTSKVDKDKNGKYITETFSSDSIETQNRFDNDYMNYNEASSRINGLEKAASKRLRIDLGDKGIAASAYGLDENDARELSDLRRTTAQSAEQSGVMKDLGLKEYTDKISGDIKNRAKTLQSEATIEMDKHKAADAYGSQKK